MKKTYLKPTITVEEIYASSLLCACATPLNQADTTACGYNVWFESQGMWITLLADSWGACQSSDVYSYCYQTSQANLSEGMVFSS